MGKITGKITYLDGIRGIAALIVFFHHFLLAFYSAYVTFDTSASHLNNLEIRFGKSVFSVFVNGLFCVNIFFVLSGYVLSRKYFQAKKYELIVSAAQRRFVRLYIPVSFTLILSFILMKAGFYYNVPVSRISHSEWWQGTFWTFPDPLAKLWHCLIFGTMFQADSSFDTSMWTLSVELYGSLFVFAILALTHNTKNLFAMLVFAFLFFMLTGRENYTTFLFGISLNYVEERSIQLNKYFNTALCFLLMIAALILGSFPAKPDVTNTLFERIPEGMLSYSDWFPVIGAWFLVLAFVLSPAMQKFVSFRFFRFLGYISFSFYLLHPIIIGSFSCFMFLKMYDRFGYNHAVALVFILTVIVCMAASLLMAKYIDVPGTKFSKYIYNYRVKKEQHATPVNERL